jgi:RNA polymerase sigma-70 factor, ECF subfamily
MSSLPDSIHSNSTGFVSTLLNRRDGAALDELLEWYRPLLKAIADRELDPLIRPKVDASDIVQETCKDIAQGFGQLQARRSFQFWSYLRKILRHNLEDARRTHKISKKRSVYRELAIAGDAGVDLNRLEDAEPLPIDKLMNDETCARLRSVLVRFPRELQRVLRWRFSKSMTYKEIGVKVQRSEDDVRMLIKRCLARIKAEVISDELAERR